LGLKIQIKKIWIGFDKEQQNKPRWILHMKL